MKVEELPGYKVAFDYMPLKAQFLQIRVSLAALIRKFGLIGAIRFMAKVAKKRTWLAEQYGDVVSTRFANVPASGIRELYLLSSMYYVLSEKEDQANAYEFLKDIFRKIGPTAHAAIYNLKDLRKCEGDVFANFCKLNRAIFENSAKKGYYGIEAINDSQNLQFLRLTKCLNVDAFTALGCRELARLACEADKSGYAPDALGDKVDLDFRRPTTIVKGDVACEFHYYRKGHAPKDMATF